MIAFVEGLAVSLSLILAIGPQNAFVLRQGLMQRHVFAVCVVCVAADALLFALGIGGVGQAIEAADGLGPAMGLAGAAFLAWYAYTRLAAAMRPTSLQAAAAVPASLAMTLRTCLAFTFLNPHVYLDTLLLFGGLVARYEPAQHVALWAGASLGSAIFFFALGYLARALAPLLARPERWRWVEVATGVTMAIVAVVMLRFGLGALP